MKQDLVKDWMTREVITVSQDASLPQAHRLMTRHNIRRLPVLKNDRLVGIVTRGDVRGAEPSGATSLSIWEINYILAKLKIKDIMTLDPLTVSEEATISEVAQTMLDRKISGLPVVNSDNELVGIITESDIFRIIVQTWQES